MTDLLFLLVLCLVLGIAARKWWRFPPQTAEVLNAWILGVALPALVLRVMHRVQLSVDLLLAASMMWVVFLGAMVCFHLLGRVLRLGPKSVAALVLTGGLGNTAFVGIPLVESLLGAPGMAVAVFVDQAGSFLVMAIMGTFVAMRAAGGGKTTVGAVVRGVVLFPPFIALVLAVLTRPLEFPGWVEVTLGRLGNTMTPLALFAVGFQLRSGGLRERLAPLGLGLSYKLALAPVMVAVVFQLLSSPAPVVWQATVLQAAMAPMVTGGIIAAKYDLDPPLAASMVGVGIPLSLLTVPLLLALLPG
jgi:malate permease and related proteins